MPCSKHRWLDLGFVLGSSVFRHWHSSPRQQDQAEVPHGEHDAAASQAEFGSPRSTIVCPDLNALQLQSTGMAARQ